MVDLSVQEVYRLTAYNHKYIEVPDLSDDRAAFILTSGYSSGGPSPITDATWVRTSISGVVRPSAALLHRGLTTPKAGTSSIDMYFTGLHAGLVAIFDGVTEGSISDWSTSKRVTTVDFPPVTVKPGDYTAGLVLSTGSNPITAAEGSTVLINQVRLEAVNNLYASLILTDEPWQTSGTVYPKRLTFSPWTASEASYLSMVLTPSGPEGISFQIMHDGQLIPATPNLWSGGQLTPVGLNLPE